jgi:tripartite-type tricarboxylate transporter receptor subunit TctC
MEGKRMPSRRGLTRRSVLAGSAAGVAVALSGRAARAQSFPAGPVKIVVSTGAGASPDIITRFIADHLSRLWGQQVIVFNQPGGAGAVAIKAVSSAPADGTTLYMALATNFVALPELQQNFPVDLLRDFVPVGYIGDQPLIIGAAPALGVSTLAELIALLKQKPGELNIGAGNRGSMLHLTGEWLRSATGAQFTLLHYAGGARALPDLLGGRLHAMIDAIASARGPVEGGQLKPLAVSSTKRLSIFPQVPAAAETIPGFESMGWMALIAPPGTPEPLARKISDDLRSVVTTPEVQKRLEELGTYIRPTTPAELVAYIQGQQRIWGPIIAETAKKIR